MAQSNQMKIINMILKKNPHVTAGQGAKAYKALRELESKR